MAYTPPQLEIYQDYVPSPAAQARPQRALILGPAAKLVRFSQSNEQEEGSLGSYNPAQNLDYPWPNKPASSTIDLDYVRLWAKEVLLQYGADTSGSLVFAGGDDSGYPPSYLELDSSLNQGFATNVLDGVTYARHASFSQDVKLGDTVSVLYGSDPVVEAKVIGITGRAVPGTAGAVVPGGANAGDQVAATSSSQVNGTPVNLVEIDTLGSAYDGLDSGHVSEEYTVTVVTGGTAANARLDIVSTSGTDNVTNVTPAAFGSPTTIGTRGLTATFTNTDLDSSQTPDVGIAADEFVVGQSWTINVAQVFSEVGLTVTGDNASALATTYMVTVVKSGDTAAVAAGDRPQILITTLHGVDTSGPVALSSNTFNIGSYGLVGTVDSAILRKGDTFAIPVDAQAIPVLNILKLDKTLTWSGIGTAATEVKAFTTRRNVEIPHVSDSNTLNYDMDQDILTVNGSITLPGDSGPLNVVSASLYVQYRAWLAAPQGEIQSVTGSTLGDIPGVNHPDNPLKYAVTKAWMNSGNTEVWYMQVADPDDPAAWESVIDGLSEKQGFYGLAPLTQNLEVLQLLQAAVEEQAGPTSSKYRVVWFAPRVDTLAAVSDSSTSVNGTDILIRRGSTLPSGDTLFIAMNENATFLDDGVRSGDTVRYLYAADILGNETWKTATIKEVIGQDSFTVTAPGIPVAEIPTNTDVKIEIWRNRNAEDLTQAYLSLMSSVQSSRVRLVIPGQVGSAGLQVPAYHLAAAYAGFRSGTHPHRPLTNTPISGFDDLSAINQFSSTQLNRLAEAGGFIVHRTQSGSIVCRHALTSYGPSDDLLSEDSVIANVDSISEAIKADIADLVGIANVTPLLLTAIRLRVIGTLVPFQDPVDAYIGAQIVEVGEITVWQDELDPKRVVIRIPLTIAVPANTIETHIEITA